MPKTGTILIVVCVSLAAILRASPQAGAPAASKTKSQGNSQSASETPLPNQNAVKKTNAGKTQPNSQLQPVAHPADKPASKATLPGTAYGKPAVAGKFQQIITSNIAPACVPSSVNVKNPAACAVEDVTRLPDGTTLVQELPYCDRTHGPSCWRFEVKPQCRTISKQSMAITIARGPAGAPANTDTSASCSM